MTLQEVSTVPRKAGHVEDYVERTVRALLVEHYSAAVNSDHGHSV